MDSIFNILNHLIDNAKQLGALGAAAVWAFFNLLLIAYVIWLKRTADKASECAWAARVEEAKADGLIATAMSKMADEIKELRHVIDHGGTNA